MCDYGAGLRKTGMIKTGFFHHRGLQVTREPILCPNRFKQAGFIPRITLHCRFCPLYKGINETRPENPRNRTVA
jgi:hypothetical protein